MESSESMSAWPDHMESSIAGTRAEDYDDSKVYFTTPMTWHSTEDSTDTDSWSDSEGGDNLWLGMDLSPSNEWKHGEEYDFSRAAGTTAEECPSPDSDSLCGDQLTDTESMSSLSDSGSELNHVPQRHAAQATNDQLEPLRMTVLAGQRAGDVCYAQVPRTGQRVAGSIPPGLSPGDKFLLMYRPAPQVANGRALGANARIVELAMTKARTTMEQLTVEEALALLQEAGGQLPGRPLRLQDPIENFLFREVRTHQRRQKHSVGRIDRWKNSGGKRAVVTLDIPPAHDGSNVLAYRHGKVFRADGRVTHYRQWTLGTQVGDDLHEPKDANHNTLYQIFVQPEQDRADNSVQWSTPEPLPSPPAPPSRPMPAEIDFTLLRPSAAKRTFGEGRWNPDSQELLLGDGLPTPKKKRFAGMYVSVAVMAILGVCGYMYTGKSDADSDNPSNYDSPPVNQGVTCTNGTFSADGTTCKPCSSCPGMTGAACTPTTDTRCVSWEEHLDSSPTNQTQPWHLPQFAAVWGDTSTTFAFGGKGPATPLSEQVQYETEACTTLAGPMSNELWVRESSQWRYLGGTVARSNYGTRFSLLGEAGWPLHRSSAASWSIPSDISAPDLLPGLSAVLFSGSFLPPCAETSALGVRSLLNPSDLWTYQRSNEPGNPVSTGRWMLVGGQQSWAEPPDGNEITVLLQEGQLTMPTVGGDLTQPSQQSPAWPLGRHDAHTWVVGGSLLLFSGAMDWYQRAGGGQTAKRACLLNDYWLLHIDKKGITWQNGGGLTKGTVATPRPRQPGPRVFGATWSSANPTSSADVAWLFGGIGSTYCEGDGIWGSAVAAPADRLLLDQTGASADCAMHTMCDLWSYTANSAGESPWELVGACASDMQLLNQHSKQLGMSLSILAQLPDIALTEAVLATTWVDSDQNLWLFGGAQCKEVPDSSHSCASVLKDELNPRPAVTDSTQGRRQLAEIWRTYAPAADATGYVPSPPPAVARAAALEGLGEGFTATGSDTSWVDPSPSVVPGTYSPFYPSPPSSFLPGYVPPAHPAAAPLAGTMGETTVIPCTDELWKFDTVAMEWSSLHAVVREQQWPAGECGASAIPPRTTEAGSSSTDLVGGWNFRAFATCGSDDHTTGADCSSKSWLFGPEQP